MKQPSLQIHHWLAHSQSNGPGLRAVIWVQGCGLACPGCFNPETHDFSRGVSMRIDDLAQQILALQPEIEGVTISGGEPLAQMDGITYLLQQIRAQSTLSTLIFTGYTLEEVHQRRKSAALLAVTDVLIAGRYIAAERVAQGLIGSANKQIHYISQRYQATDFVETPTAEIWIDPDGTIGLSGIDPVIWDPSP